MCLKGKLVMSKFFNISVIAVLVLFCIKTEFSQTNISLRDEVIAPNEALAVESCIRIMEAEREYYSGSGAGNFNTFPWLMNAGLIEFPLAGGISNGYNLTLFAYYATPTQPSYFYVQATPRIFKVTGIRSFYCDQTGVIRGANKRGGLATSNDPPISF
jgi:hypothetical protein